MARVSLRGDVVKATSLVAHMKDKHRGSAFRRFGILPPIDKYRGIVEEAVFDRLGRPSFFDEAPEMVMGRIKARVEQKNP
jgi:hypothetical protein